MATSTRSVRFIGRAPLLERMYRDVRCGGFHPANAGLVHEIVGKTATGILGKEPRW